MLITVKPDSLADIIIDIGGFFENWHFWKEI
jgi:hypothetical protein